MMHTHNRKAGVQDMLDDAFPNGQRKRRRDIMLVTILILACIITITALLAGQARAHDIITEHRSLLMPYTLPYTASCENETPTVTIAGTPVNATGSWEGSVESSLQVNTTRFEVNVTSINQTICPEVANITEWQRSTNDRLANYTSEIVGAVINVYGPRQSELDALRGELDTYQDAVFAQTLNISQHAAELAVITAQRDVARQRANLMTWLALVLILATAIILLIHYRSSR